MNCECECGLSNDLSVFKPDHIRDLGFLRWAGSPARNCSGTSPVDEHIVLMAWLDQSFRASTLES
jgi:hypothetical protein